MLRRLTQAAIAAGLSLILLLLPAFGQASLIPNAKQTFVDGNGNPYASGKVFMYVPNTTTKKNTWQNSGQTNLNVNPVILDAAGRATIFGIGSYRQVLQDVNGVSVWDGVTTAPLTAATPTPSGTGDFMPLGNVMLIAGFTPPTNYVMANGQALNRTTYADALIALTINSSATCISGNTTVSGISSTGQIRIGAPVEASCLAAGTTVSTIAGPTSITVSAAATANGATTIRVFNYGNGNGSTTFNVPDLRGRVPAGGECFDGLTCPSPSRLTTAFYGVNPNTSGAVGGAQSATMVQNNLPAINFVHSGTTLSNPAPSPITTSNLGTLNGKIVTQSGADAIVGIGGGGAAINLTQNTQATSVSAQGTAASGGSSTPFSIIQPTITLNYVIKVLNGNLPTVGVLSLGGMTGDILCGSGLDCTDQTISVSLSNITLPQNQIFIGSAINVAASVTMNGDCIIVFSGLIICTKTNGTNFGTMATQNANSVNIGGGTIGGMPNPTLGGDVANKTYVDGLASGIVILAQSGLATAAVLPNTPTYSNGAAGVGATLTAGANSTLTVDATVATLGTIVLVKDQASTFQNGIYSVTTAGSGAAAWVLTRVTYFDTAAEMLKGSYTLITGGATNANKAYVLAATVATVGTDPATFNLFSASATPWVVAGSDIYYTTGLVGIGTAAPAALLHLSGTTLTTVQEFTNTSSSDSFTIGQANAFAGIQGNRNISTGTIFDASKPAAYIMMQIAAGDSSLQFGTSATNNVAATERVRVTKNGDVGVGTTTPIFDTNTSGRFFALNNSTANQVSEFGAGGNATVAGNYVGSYSFWNSSLGTTEKRTGIISSKTVAVTNSGNIELRSVNAGTAVLNASMQPYGLTNIVGGLSINADFQTGTDITAALNLALGTQSNVRLPCGTFLVSSAINFGLAGQTLSGCGREGTVIQVTGAGAISWIINVSSLANTGMYDLTIDGNNASGLTAGCANATGPSTKTKWIRVGCIRTTTAANNAAGFAFTSSNNTAANSARWSEIRDCYLEDIQAINSSYNSHSILLQYADYSSVTGCTSVNIDNGINTQASNWVVVANNTFVGNSGAASPTGFGGIRCSNGTVGATITGNTVRDMARGIFLLGCTNTAVTGNSITNTQLQSILISATTGNATPTQYNTVSGNTMQDTCLNNTCNYAIEFNSGGGGVQQGVVAIGNSYSRVSTPVSTAMIGISGGVGAGQNTCANNTASITVGTC